MIPSQDATVLLRVANGKRHRNHRLLHCGFCLMILALSVYSKAPKSDDCSRLTNFRHKLYCIDICRDLIRRSYIFLDNPNANGQMDEVNSESILRSMLLRMFAVFINLKFGPSHRGTA